MCTKELNRLARTKKNTKILKAKWSGLAHIVSSGSACRGVYITDSVLVNLDIRSSCAIGNNELVVTQN